MAILFLGLGSMTSTSRQPTNTLSSAPNTLPTTSTTLSTFPNILPSAPNITKTTKLNSENHSPDLASLPGFSSSSIMSVKACGSETSSDQSSSLPWPGILTCLSENLISDKGNKKIKTDQNLTSKKTNKTKSEPKVTIPVQDKENEEVSCDYCDKKMSVKNLF